MRMLENRSRVAAGVAERRKKCFDKAASLDQSPFRSFLEALRGKIGNFVVAEEGTRLGTYEAVVEDIPVETLVDFGS